MATIKLYNSQITESPTGGNVRANPGAFDRNSGAPAAAANNAISTALSQVAQITSVIYDAEQQSKLAAADTQLKRKWQEVATQIEAEPNADKHADIYNQFLTESQAIGEEFKGDYGRLWQENYDSKITATQTHLNALNRRRRVDNAKSNYRIAIEAAIESKDTAAAEAAIDKMQDLGLLAAGDDGSPIEAIALKEQATRQISISALQEHINAAPSEAIEALSSSEWQQAYPALTTDDRNRLLQDAYISNRRNKQIAKEQQIEVEHQSQNELYAMHIEGQLTQQTLHEYFAAGKISPSQHQAFSRQLEQQAKAEEAESVLEANEELYAMHIEGQLTQRVLNDWFAAGKIDSKLHEAYSRAISAAAPNVGDKDVYFAAKQAIRQYRDGAIDYASVNDFLSNNYQSLTIAQYNQLVNDLDTTKSNYGKDDIQTKAKLDWGESVIAGLLDNGNVLGAAGSLGETNRAAELLSQWEQLVRSGATQEQLDAFMQAAATDVWGDSWLKHKAFEGYDTEALNESNRKINELMLDVLGD